MKGNNCDGVRLPQLGYELRNDRGLVEKFEGLDPVGGGILDVLAVAVDQLQILDVHTTGDKLPFGFQEGLFKGNGVGSGDERIVVVDAVNFQAENRVRVGGLGKYIDCGIYFGRSGKVVLADREGVKKLFNLNDGDFVGNCFGDSLEVSLLRNFGGFGSGGDRKGRSRGRFGGGGNNRSGFRDDGLPTSILKNTDGYYGHKKEEGEQRK